MTALKILAAILFFASPYIGFVLIMLKSARELADNVYTTPGRPGEP